MNEGYPRRFRDIFKDGIRRRLRRLIRRGASCADQHRDDNRDRDSPQAAQFFIGRLIGIQFQCP